MSATRILALSVLFLAALGGLPSAVGATPRSANAGYRVIVNPANPVEVLDRSFLTEAFLKKATRWSNDLFIRPADQASEAACRQAFSEDIMKKSVAAVKSYWQQMVFSGRGVPPPELDNDEEVVKFVLRNPGAVGYVSPGANTGGTKTVTVR